MSSEEVVATEDKVEEAVTETENNVEEVVTETENKVEDVVEDKVEEVVEEVEDKVEEINKVMEDTSNKIAEATNDLVAEHLDNAVNTVLDDALGDIELNEQIGDVVGNVVGEFAEEISKELADSVLNDVKEKLGDMGVKSSTLTIIIKYTMEVIETTPVKGKAQMDLALRIIGDLINELPENDEKEFLLKTLNNGGIKDTIELIVDVSKGKVNINKITETAGENCLGPCIEYILSKCR